MFLDYCHMTAEGINIAGAEITSRIVSLVAGKQVSAVSILSRAPWPAPEVEGRACFLAASHNAAFYQNVDIVKYFCNRALALWPDCAQLMRYFADYSFRDLPMVICKSGLEFDRIDRLDTRPYLGHGRRRRLDLTFADAAIASLADIGIRIGDELAASRIKEHAVGCGPRELIEFFYSAAIPAPSERRWISSAFATNHGSHAMYASAFWEASRFVFFAEKGQGIDIKFTYRVRFLPASGGAVRVNVNGHSVAELPASRTWRTQRICVPNERIAEGLNEVLISWPVEEPPSEVLLAEAADRLLMRQLPYLFRVFGEIHSLSVANRPIGSRRVNGREPDSESPFSTRGTVVCPGDGAVDHLQGIAAAARGESAQHQVPEPACGSSHLTNGALAKPRLRLEAQPSVVAAQRGPGSRHQSVRGTP